MLRTNIHRIDTAKPPTGALDLDASLIDADFDDVLDREVFALRESLADHQDF